MNGISPVVVLALLHLITEGPTELGDALVAGLILRWIRSRSLGGSKTRLSSNPWG